MVPDADYRCGHKPHTDEQVKDEEQEVSVVFEADTIVDPRTVVIHYEDASVADRAVMCPCGLYFIALVTPLRPENL